MVCEGVETPEQLAFLRTLRCDAVQGFLLARPMAAAATGDWLRRYRDGDPALHAWRCSAAPTPRRAARATVELA